MSHLSPSLLFRSRQSAGAERAEELSPATLAERSPPTGTIGDDDLFKSIVPAAAVVSPRLGCRAAQGAQSELSARASALAGSVLSLLRWWLDRGAKESPRAMDELFHRMVWNGLQ